MFRLFVVTIAAVTAATFHGQYFSIDKSTCMIATTKGYGYHDFFPQIKRTCHACDNQSRVDLYLMVRVAQDAHILLSPVAAEAANVYEIVLGAGRDTYTTLRRQARGGSVATVMTSDILSESVDKAFWIHVDDDTIYIHQQDDPEPLLQWKDPTPIPIQYFSVSSWMGVEAEWHLNCQVKVLGDVDNPITSTRRTKADNAPWTNTTVTFEPTSVTNQTDVRRLNSSAIERLRMDLLLMYDPYVAPSNGSGVFSVFCQHLDLTEKTGQAIFNGYFSMTWHDKTLKWDPQTYANITTIRVPNGDVWVPQIISSSSAQLLAKTITVNHDGFVTYKPTVSLFTWCESFDFDTWPRETYTCQFTVDFNPMDMLILFRENAENTSRKSTWDVTKTHVDFRAGAEKQMGLVLELRRDEPIVSLVVGNILAAIITLNLLGFWITPFTSAKLGLFSLQLVLLAALFFLITAKLPLFANVTPFLVKKSIITAVIVSSSLIISVVTIRIARTNHTKPMPKCLYRVLKLQMVRSIFLLNDILDCDSYGNLDTYGDCSDIQAIWIVFALAFDRLSFIIFTVAYIVLYFV